ncbi:carbohydrate sulfotransferase 8-like [Parambassis ranga]|uniref:Carbohydrate sulfotransferase n=1 Tax=Parambassis ranga TaxID=210632 RepID=A0A6P7KA79_9TELE|nr:carbohydrate sulfotransferase 8-like [Parambassis ranga]XP_028286443.1 carbohydrate sulfotransferase 8-like [Parambassis ranga]XP_028286444.1 carbohydrate sulfotransferase 8-like [Parambassis ranga]
MSPVDCSLQDSVCVRRRRLLSALMKPPCLLFYRLWFLLLLGAGSVLLLVCLQDLTETVFQQSPGAQVLLSSRWPAVKDAAVQGEDGLHLQQASISVFSEPSLGSKPPVTKRHRKLLKSSYAAASSPPTGEEALQQRSLARTLEARRRLLTDICAKYQPGVTEQRVSQRQVSRVYVEDRSRLLYCEVPKAGCSNWKRVLMVLGGSANNTRDIPHDAAHYANRLRRLESYKRAGIIDRLRSYTKVLFIREPFERLVSAFRDKFESPNSYYHPVFGRPIISRYRANATRTALRTGAGVTFREFIQYLLDVRRPVGMDIHWEPVSQLCNPCLLRYDFIGKFESLEEEANFLLRSIGAPTNLTFPDFKDRNPLAERTSSKITQEYFSQLNATERQKAFDFYYMDYLMFNYSKPFEDLH